jgi:hypothetical protein
MRNKLALAALALAVVTGASGLAAAQDGRYGDRDDNRYSDRDDYRYSDRDGYRNDNFRRGLKVAREVGYRDGTQVAREDMWKNKPFNPNPRGRYDNADHGYRGQFGNRREYREHYSEAYRDAYANTFRERGHYR